MFFRTFVFERSSKLYLFRAEMNRPKEISSTYSSVMCSAIQVFHGIVMLIARFPWLFAKRNVVQYNSVWPQWLSVAGCMSLYVIYPNCRADYENVVYKARPKWPNAETAQVNTALRILHMCAKRAVFAPLTRRGQQEYKRARFCPAPWCPFCMARYAEKNIKTCCYFWFTL